MSCIGRQLLDGLRLRLPVRLHGVRPMLAQLLPSAAKTSSSEASFRAASATWSSPTATRAIAANGCQNHQPQSSSGANSATLRTACSARQERCSSDCSKRLPRPLWCAPGHCQLRLAAAETPRLQYNDGVQSPGGGRDQRRQQQVLSARPRPRQFRLLRRVLARSGLVGRRWCYVGWVPRGRACSRASAAWRLGALHTRWCNTWPTTPSTSANAPSTTACSACGQVGRS